MSDLAPDRPDPRTLFPDPDRKVKVGHLVIGLVFLGLSAAWALRANGTLGDLEIAVVVPVVLVLSGLVGLVTLVVGNLRRGRERRAVYLGPAYPDIDPRPESRPEPEPDSPPEPEPTLPLQTPQHDDDSKEQS